jgi:hypothetical protein
VIRLRAWRHDEHRVFAAGLARGVAVLRRQAGRGRRFVRALGVHELEVRLAVGVFAAHEVARQAQRQHGDREREQRACQSR